MTKSPEKRFARHTGWRLREEIHGINMDSKPLTPQETGVLEQVAKGRDAHLKVKFGEGRETPSLGPIPGGPAHRRDGG